MEDCQDNSEEMLVREAVQRILEAANRMTTIEYAKLRAAQERNAETSGRMIIAPRRPKVIW